MLICCLRACIWRTLRPCLSGKLQAMRLSFFSPMQLQDHDAFHSFSWHPNTMQRVCGISKAPHGFSRHPYNVVEEDLITMSSLRVSRSLLMKLQHEATCDFVSLPTNMIVSLPTNMRETICYFHTDLRARWVQYFEALQECFGIE